MGRPISRTDPWKVVSVSCSEALWKQTGDVAGSLGITKREFVEEALRRELARLFESGLLRPDGQLTTDHVKEPAA